MTYTKENIKEYCQKYGLGLSIIRKVCNYYDSEEDVYKVLNDLSHSSTITDYRDSLFDAYLDNNPEMKRQ